MRVFSKDEVLKRVRDKSMSPKEAMEALRPEPEETDKLDDIKKLLKDAVEKFQVQNARLIEIAKADLVKSESGEIINALQSMTKDIIKALKQVEEIPAKKWKLETASIERGKDGKVMRMEVMAEQV